MHSCAQEEGGERGPRLAVACPEEEGIGAGVVVGGRVGEADHQAERGRVTPPWPALAAASSRVEADPAARLQAHGDLERWRVHHVGLRGA